VKIMVTGSRHWGDKLAVWSALQAAIGPDLPGARLYVGDCPSGADEIATSWWRENMTANNLHVIRSQGLKAYQMLARNQLLVDHMPDIALGFVLYGEGVSRGTNDALNRAREAGLWLVVQERPAPANLCGRP
jgi:hypothetical protein